MSCRVRSEDYIRHLESWPKAAARHLYTPPNRRDLTCYGPGCNGWGVQTNQKAMAALGVLAAAPELDEGRAGTRREELLELSLRLLRFSLESHLAGSHHCTDGSSWGHTWISALGIERMMHAVDALEAHLSEADRALLKAVLVSECDWLLDEYEIVAGVVEDNKPESNLWNGALLHRTAMMYDDLGRSAEYREKGSRFLVNAISVPSDARNDAVVDGRSVRDMHVGPQFFESYALAHHRYLNVGYMAICLSNAAMLHFAYRLRGLTPPEALHHHVADLWRLVKQCTFPDGRLCRIGGDTRVRYCYCQDYAIPAWLLAADLLGDASGVSFEHGWLGLVRREQEANGDGSFLSQRGGQLARSSPLYYTRLEADRAVALSMGALWRRKLDMPDRADAPPGPARPFAWSDEYHGAVFHRGTGRIASFVWRAAEAPQGMCLPPTSSDLAEWRQNLAGRIEGEGRFTWQQVVEHHEQTFEGGFLTWGSATVHTEEPVVPLGQEVEAFLQELRVPIPLPNPSLVVGSKLLTIIHEYIVVQLHITHPLSSVQSGGAVLH